MRRRAFFGLFDAEGWPWAGAKAAFWFVVIIFLLGYIPDRAYYFTVERTIDLGILAWSPVNLCPPENEGLPCPVPAGAPLPWHPSPPELALPAARTDGTVVQLGSRLLYIGGTNGATPQPDVYVAQTSGVGNFQPWQPGPPLPTALTDTSAAFLGGSIYVAGGADTSRKPTSAVYRMTPGADGALPAWAKVDALVLPEPRAGAALVAAGDGLILVGGTGPNGPTKTVWKSKLDAKGNLGPWAVEPGQLFEANTGGVGAIVGEDVWLLGGQGPDGKPVRTVQIGRMGSTPVVAGGASAAAGSAPAGAAASGGPPPQGAVRSGGAAAPGRAGAGGRPRAAGRRRFRRRGRDGQCGCGEQRRRVGVHDRGCRRGEPVAGQRADEPSRAACQRRGLHRQRRALLHRRDRWRTAAVRDVVGDSERVRCDRRLEAPRRDRSAAAGPHGLGGARVGLARIPRRRPDEERDHAGQRADEPRPPGAVFPGRGPGRHRPRPQARG